MIDQFYCVNQMVCKNEVKQDNAPIGLFFLIYVYSSKKIKLSDSIKTDKSKNREDTDHQNQDGFRTGY